MAAEHGTWDSKAIRAGGSRNGEPQLDRGHSNPTDLPYPEQGLVLTPFLTVRDVARPRDFYADIFGGRVVLNENSAIVKAANSWLIMNRSGGPTPEEPDVIPAPGLVIRSRRW